jgi:23S rRNA (uracil1939-C5)-methyltransferase
VVFDAVCAGLDEAGAGLADIVTGEETLRVHVAGALPGERVRGRLGHVSVHARAALREAWADVEAVLDPSANRVLPICPAQGRCGSCPLMTLAYPAQLAWKRDRVSAHLATHGELAGIGVAPCVPSPLVTGYRNQAKYVYGKPRDAQYPVLGAYAPRSHAIVDLAGCHVVQPAIEEIRRALLAILVAQAVVPYDEIRRTGVLRYVIMRATTTGRVLVTLVVGHAGVGDAGAWAAALAEQCPSVAGVVLNVNATVGNTLFGDEEHLLVGQSTVDDEIGDVRVRLASRSFFQANHQVASRIYRDLVSAAAGAGNHAVDVYAGAGGIAFSLATIAEDVVAIEDNPAATQVAAAFIAEQTSVRNRVRMVTGDAAVCLAEIEAADLVVVNPPRKGCGQSVLAAIGRLRPGFVGYLSCDPQTLARDLAVLVSQGLALVGVTPYDMMPHTPHVETLALLRR